MPLREIIILSKLDFELSYSHLTTLKATGSAKDRVQVRGAVRR